MTTIDTFIEAANILSSPFQILSDLAGGGFIGMDKTAIMSNLADNMKFSKKMEAKAAAAARGEDTETSKFEKMADSWEEEIRKALAYLQVAFSTQCMTDPSQGGGGMTAMNEAVCAAGDAIAEVKSALQMLIALLKIWRDANQGNLLSIVGFAFPIKDMYDLLVDQLMKLVSMALDPFFSPIETSLAYSFTSPAWEVVKAKCPWGFDINIELFCFVLDIKSDLLLKLKGIFDIDVQNIQMWEDLTIKKTQIAMLDALINLLEMLLDFLTNFGECFNSDDLLNDFFAAELAGGYMNIDEYIAVAYDAGIPIDEALTLSKGTPSYTKRVNDLFTSKGLPPGSDILTLFAPVSSSYNQSQVVQNIVQSFKPRTTEVPVGPTTGEATKAMGVDASGNLIPVNINMDEYDPTEMIITPASNPGKDAALDFIRSINGALNPLNNGSA
jgi:hypothetical protein